MWKLNFQEKKKITFGWKILTLLKNLKSNFSVKSCVFFFNKKWHFQLKRKEENNFCSSGLSIFPVFYKYSLRTVWEAPWVPPLEPKARSLLCEMAAWGLPAASDHQGKAAMSRPQCAPACVSRSCGEQNFLHFRLTSCPHSLSGRAISAGPGQRSTAPAESTGTVVPLSLCLVSLLNGHSLDPKLEGCWALRSAGNPKKLGSFM